MVKETPTATIEERAESGVTYLTIGCGIVLGIALLIASGLIFIGIPFLAFKFNFWFGVIISTASLIIFSGATFGTIMNNSEELKDFFVWLQKKDKWSN